MHGALFPNILCAWCTVHGVRMARATRRPTVTRTRPGSHGVVGRGSQVLGGVAGRGSQVCDPARPRQPRGGVHPPILGPLILPPVNVNIRHPKVALTAVFRRIKRPDHPGYPALTGLRPGIYICTLNYQWSNLIVSIDVHK